MELTGTHFGASDRARIGIYRVGPPDGGTHPGLIIFPSIFGVTDELEQHANEISRSGAVVLAFDPFSRVEDSGPIGEADQERAFKRLDALDFARVNQDFRELLSALKQDAQCNGRVVGLGICLGGGFIWNAAADHELAGVATWHGSRMGDVMDRAAQLECPVIMDFGDETRWFHPRNSKRSSIQ